MSETDPTVTVSATLDTCVTVGEPSVTFHNRERLQIYPVGIGSSGLLLWFSVEDWRKLNAAVEDAIPPHTPDEVQAVFTPADAAQVAEDAAGLGVPLSGGAGGEVIAW